jgi:hypothetical protein
MGADEELEIAFWWFGGDSHHRIEDGLEDFLDQRGRARRRSRTFPGHRPRRNPTTEDDSPDEGRPVA